MKKILIPSLLALLVIGISSLGTGQEMDDQACQQTIKESCTKCHSTKRICDKLDYASANWDEIITKMGKRGNLSQEVQDEVFNCLTTTSDPKKLACPK